jgi:thymidylate kinase
VPFIAFLGCDGSGKSAVIDGLKTILEARGHQVTLGHWRPKAFGTASSTASQAADDPHGQSPRGLVASVLKLGWLWLKWWAAWFRHLRGNSRSGYVLFDRYHGDLLVDPIRYRYGGPMWLATLASRMMPQPDHVLFLDAPPEILLSRKTEVSEDALISSRRKYLKFCELSPRCRLIDASQTLRSVISNAKKVVADSDNTTH